MMAKKKVRTREMWLTNDEEGLALWPEKPRYDDEAEMWLPALGPLIADGTQVTGMVYKKDEPKPGPNGVCKARVTVEVL